ncbi:LysR substrate-binding domain-containing protein [Polaromonas aquatica]|uniref:LysR substrate-binding domain-containing protein n=1 Tax=Polaromonas aquatica TaxID=332657 RepID=UPI003D6517FD
MITELKTFIAVVRHGSFSAAGARIGLTQSAVSSQIKRLEASLGFELFDRTRRTAVLNTHGSQTLARAEEIVAMYSRLGDLPVDEDLTGTLRIGAIASVQSALLPRALAAMRRKHPKLRLNIVPGVSMRLMDELDAGEIDAAIMIRPPFGLLPEMTWQPLVSEPFVLLVPEDVKGRDWRRMLASHPFLRYERTSFGGRLVTRFLRDENITVQEAIELDEITGLMNLVSQGLGVALVPMAEACLPIPPSVRAVALGEQTFYREIGLLLRGKKQGPAVVQQLAQCLRDAASEVKPSRRRGTAAR